MLCPNVKEIAVFQCILAMVRVVFSIYVMLRHRRGPGYFPDDECHDPNCNLLPLTCDLNRVLTDYMPYFDVLKDVLIPYIGYHVVYYVLLKADNVEFVDFDTRFASMDDDGYVDAPFFDRGWSRFREPEVVRSNQIEKHVAKQQVLDGDDTETESSSVPVPRNLFGFDDFSD